MPLDIFGDIDILGVWLRLLLSPFGLMIVGLTLVGILLNSLARPPQRRRGPRPRNDPIEWE